MKAISLIPGTKSIHLAEVEEPMISHADEVKIKVQQVGICGTDREEAEGGRAEAPRGKVELIIGHEMFGQVTETGEDVQTVKVGDYAVFTVRRGCSKCPACKGGRSDLCYTGLYTERGIKGADGFQSEFVVDKEEYAVKVPEVIKDLGVLTEPMSIAAKAISEATLIQSARLKKFEFSENWIKGKKVLVAGIGAIGLLAAFALRLRGAEVLAVDIVDEDSLRPQILREIGGTYVDGRLVETMDIDKVYGSADLIFEAAGVPKLQLELIDALAFNGIYIATGIPDGKRPVTIPAGDLIQQLVLKNQVVIGSVNAGIEHYEMAVRDLQACHERWPDAMAKLITERFHFSEFQKALHHHSVDEIKVVIDWI